MAFTSFAKKLYFNLAWTSGATTSVIYGISAAVTKFIPCTPFRPSLTFGDRYGNLLESMAAVTGNSPPAQKGRGAVTAFFVPNQTNRVGATTVTTGVFIDFVAPTFQVVGNTDLVPLLPYLSVDGTPVLRNFGKDVIYGTLGQQRHFSLRVRRAVAPSTHTLSGVVYVARQHSIEV